jgi:murein L,D-transpeptidase YcbB/YkuD
LFKKYACYLSLGVLAAPLVVAAEALMPLPSLPTSPAPEPQSSQTAPLGSLATPPSSLETPSNSQTASPGPQPAAPDQLTAPTSLTAQCPALLRVDAPTLKLLQALYLQHGDAPLWSVNGRLANLREQLPLLADDGLDPSHYPLPAGDAPDGLCADIQISQRYLLALHDLRYGRLSQARFEPLWRAQPLVEDHQAELLAIADPGLDNIAGAFEQARPRLAQYHNLRHVYIQQRQQALPHWQPLPSGPLLRPDMQDVRVPELTQRLFSEGYLSSPQVSVENTYGSELVDAVKSFQLNHSLQADGVIGPGTLNELNISPSVRREQLRLNLERLRWLAQDLEPSSVLVNVAAAQLTVYRDGLPVWQTRTQVGRAERQTPLLKSRVTRLTLNPTWTVPPTILREDKLPEIRRDQSFLSRQNLEVLDSEGQPLAPEDIDWEHPGNILLRQGAGPRNPLGRMVIRFPNPFSVYLHDTPSQGLFSKGPRAFSSGCVRVEQALQLRDWLLSPAERRRTDELLTTGLTHEFRLAAPLPILLSYWTVQADDQGRVVYAPDIYSRDGPLLSALGSVH